MLNTYTLIFVLSSSVHFVLMQLEASKEKRLCHCCDQNDAH